LIAEAVTCAALLFAAYVCAEALIYTWRNTDD
jgi:hypothetical protein